MPIVESTYNPTFLFKNGHWATVYSGVFRKVGGVVQKRERIDLNDGDFLDLDWSESTLPTKKTVIILHGLEGDAQRPYIIGAAKLLNQNGYDACAVNLRSCSGEPNRLFRSYHSGATEDVEAVVNHILNAKNYEFLFLLGFSLGGNLTLKYLGERKNVPAKIKAAMAVSVPCDLESTCEELMSSKNFLYSLRFKKHLIGKLKIKQQHFPNMVSQRDIKSIKTLKDFDNVYTSRANGFEDAIDYYTKSSSKQFLSNIKTPTLILNAKNDSFLNKKSYPLEEARKNRNLYLEIPNYGGHVGFNSKGSHTFAEIRALNFFNTY